MPKAPYEPRRRMQERIGIGLSAIAVLFLLFDATGKLLEVAPVIEACADLGYPAGTVQTLGLILALCVGIYLVPRFAVVGAVLLTGFLGGAIAAHVRVGNPLLTHVLFPIYVAVCIWGGLYLRDPRVRWLLESPE